MHRFAVLLAGALTLLLSPHPAAAYTVGSGTVTQTVNVQLIDVCGVSGSATVCAPDTSQQVQAYETYANAIYAQAGIAFAFNPTIPQITIAGNSGCAGGAASTFCVSGLLDTAHQLVDTPNPGRSTVANALNVYLVNSLVTPSTTSPVYGWGLIGGNGVVMMTGSNTTTGKTSAVDTLAHELGHNLGLGHIDQSNNLMDTGTRVIPFEVCQVAPYSCDSPLGAATGTLPTAAASARNTATLKLSGLTGTGGVPVQPGMVATGTGIPANDTVLSVDTSSNTVTLSAPLSGAVGTGASISFASPPQTDVLADGALQSQTAALAASKGATSLTLAGTAGVLPGMVVSGAGIPSGDTVVSVDPVANTVTLASPLSAAVAANAKVQLATATIGQSTSLAEAVSGKVGTAGASNDTTLSLTSATGVLPGMGVTGAGIPAGETVASVSGNVITLTAPLTGAVAHNATVQFVSNTISLNGTDGVLPGMVVTGSGIQAGATVTAVNGTTGAVTLSQPLNAALAKNVTLQFVSPQISTLGNAPVLNLLPAVQVSVPAIPLVGQQNGGDCSNATGVCDVSTNYVSPASTYSTPPSGPLLKDVQYRFTDGNTYQYDAAPGAHSVTLTNYTFGPNPNPNFVNFTQTPIGSGINITMTPYSGFGGGPAALPSGSVFDTSFAYGDGIYAPPFSSEFDFTNGVVSRAGFDGTGFLSQHGQVFGFDPNTPCITGGTGCVVDGPSLLPTSPGAISPITGLPLIVDTDTSSSPLSVVAATPVPFAQQDSSLFNGCPAGPTQSFDFSYSGGGVSGHVTLTAQQVAPGQYAAISGLDMVSGGGLNGILSLYPNPTCTDMATSPGGATYDNVLMPGSDPLLTDGGLLFTDGLGGELNLWSGGPGTYFAADTTGSFVQVSLTAAPEPASIALLLTGLAGIMALRRHQRG